MCMSYSFPYSSSHPYPYSCSYDSSGLCRYFDLFAGGQLVGGTLHPVVRGLGGLAPTHVSDIPACDSL